MMSNIQQQKDLAVERFENKFFEMLRFHKECLNELPISSFTMSTTFTKRTENGMVVLEEASSRVISEIKGRDVFAALYDELIACYAICREVLHFTSFPGQEKKRAYLIKASYILCFSGVTNSSVTKVDKRSLTMINT